MDIAIKFDIIEKSGSWFSYKGEKIAQGKDNARKYLEDHPDIMKEVEDKILERLSSGDKISVESDVDLDSSEFSLDELDLD